MSKKQELSLTVADITLKIVEEKLPDSWGSFELPDSLSDFKGEKDADAVYKVHFGDAPKVDLSNLVFDSTGLWKLYQSNGSFIVTLGSPVIDEEPYIKAIAAKDYSQGDIYINKSGTYSKELFSYPMRYPLDELLFINLLSRGRGIKVHACGLIDKGEGILFLGMSGDGKSTTARIWQDEENVTILNDERLIIRKKEGKFWVYGTPWHGDAYAASPESAPLKRIYFINHGKKNHQTRLSTKDAVARLIARCFPTFWDAKGMDFALEFGHELCRNVDVYELAFTPDKSVVDFVRNN